MRIYLVLALVCVIAFPAWSETLAIKNVRLIDGTGDPELANATLLIVDGRVRAVGAKVVVPKEAVVIDGSGKTVIPGLINLHGHVGLVKGMSQARENYTRENVLDQLRRYARYGVTSVVSLGTDFAPILAVRAEQRAGKLDGARVYTAGRGFTVNGGYPAVLAGMKGIPLEVGSPEEARAEVDKLAAQKVDVVKIWVDDHLGRHEKVPPPIYAAIIDQAHKNKLKVMAHIFKLSDARGLIDAGLDGMAHSVRDTDIDDDLAARAKKRGTFVVATLSREASTFVYADAPRWLDEPFFFKGQPADAVATVRSHEYRGRVMADPDYPKLRGFLTQAQRNLKKLYDSGVKIAFGSDSGPPARFQGWGEHWELQLMVEAGLTPMQALVAATRSSAEAFGIARHFGTLEPGKHADFILLEANPLDDIRNTRKIDSVWISGRKVPSLE